VVHTLELFLNWEVLWKVENWGKKIAESQNSGLIQLPNAFYRWKMEWLELIQIIGRAKK
jgi:hypothetical protein